MCALHPDEAAAKGDMSSIGVHGIRFCFTEGDFTGARKDDKVVLRSISGVSHTFAFCMLHSGRQLVVEAWICIAPRDHHCTTWASAGNSHNLGTYFTQRIPTKQQVCDHRRREP